MRMYMCDATPGMLWFLAVPLPGGTCAGESLGAQHRGFENNNSLLVTFPFRTRHCAGALTVAFFLPDGAAVFLLHLQKCHTTPLLGSHGSV